MPKKTGADAVQENALHGHNKANEAFIQEIMTEFVREQRIIDAACGRQKESLRRGKEGGVLKTSLRKAYKDLMMTSEQKEAQDEIEERRKEYRRVCKDVGLFDHMEEAA